MSLTRRSLLQSSALTLFGLGAAPAWLSRAALGATTGGSKKILVTILLRGAMDGLNVVVPYADKEYALYRPTLALPPDRLVDLDGHFGLHPALASWKPFWESRQLAIVHAAGSPDLTRSHFDAQDYMESGTPGVKSTRDGWLNRAMPNETSPSPLRAIALGPSLPRTLRGPRSAVAVNSIASFQVRDKAGMDFEQMYAQSKDSLLSATGRETFDAIQRVEAINRQPYTPAQGVRYPGSRFAQSLQQIARIIKADAGLEVAFTDLGGWDTHVNQANALQNALNDLGSGLTAFARDLENRMSDVVIVAMSEFGRTARENGNRGTDHGHANCMFVLGGPVKGGKVHGEWPGLALEQLNENRDLAVTTDFRDVLGEITAKHLGNPQLATVFPGYDPNPKRFRGVL